MFSTYDLGKVLLPWLHNDQLLWGPEWGCWHVVGLYGKLDGHVDCMGMLTLRSVWGLDGSLSCWQSLWVTWWDCWLVVGLWNGFFFTSCRSGSGFVVCLYVDCMGLLTCLYGRLGRNIDWPVCMGVLSLRSVWGNVELFDLLLVCLGEWKLGCWVVGLYGGTGLCVFFISCGRSVLGFVGLLQVSMGDWVWGIGRFDLSVCMRFVNCCQSLYLL